MTRFKKEPSGSWLIVILLSLSVCTSIPALNNKLNSLILGQTKIKYGAVSLQCSSGDYAQTTINVDEYRSYQIMVSQSTSHNGVTVCSAGNIIYAFRNSSAVMNIGINYIVIGTLK